jgi:uncharacterized protein YutE (UPF0331/DUF86 family)
MDEILINKKASIERCIRRIRDDYQDDFSTNYTKQDSVILNIERACQLAIDMGNRVVKLHSLGLPQSNRDTFLKLEKEGILPLDLSKTMQSMAGFRNIAVHDYSSVNIEIIQNIVNNHLQDLLKFSELMIDIA